MTDVPVDEGHLFVARMDDWRKALGWGHGRFAAHLGISPCYWWMLRTRRRGLSVGVARRVLRERPELGHFVAAAFRARRWRAKPEGAP